YSAFTESDFLPFLAGIRAGADAVMVSHNIVNYMDPEHPASLSPEVHRILREELGFTGVIMTDDLGMNAINLYTGGQNAAVAAVLAGNDFVMFADDAASADAIVAAVESGLISEEQINESVLRILRWKQSLGLIE
ncbi:MAG: beta-hexosaminidase, partial [Oscillospiraceae bacterium]|nr:beta-hexosaminidase [Oscillospiraceae bacterium]